MCTLDITRTGQKKAQRISFMYFDYLEYLLHQWKVSLAWPFCCCIHCSLFWSYVVNDIVTSGLQCRTNSQPYNSYEWYLWMVICGNIAGSVCINSDRKPSHLRTGIYQNRLHCNVHCRQSLDACMCKSLYSGCTIFVSHTSFMLVFSYPITFNFVNCKFRTILFVMTK